MASTIRLRVFYTCRSIHVDLSATLSIRLSKQKIKIKRPDDHGSKITKKPLKNLNDYCIAQTPSSNQSVYRLSRRVQN